MTQFERSSQLKDLEEAISLHREALDLLLASHPRRSGSLNNLASASKTRFELSGHLEDLEEAISLHRGALESFPVLHPERPVSQQLLQRANGTVRTNRAARKTWKKQLGCTRTHLDRPVHPILVDLPPSTTSQTR